MWRSRAIIANASANLPGAAGFLNCAGLANTAWRARALVYAGKIALSRLRQMCGGPNVVIRPLITKNSQGGDMANIVTDALPASVAGTTAVSPAKMFWVTWFGWM